MFSDEKKSLQNNPYDVNSSKSDIRIGSFQNSNQGSIIDHAISSESIGIQQKRFIQTKAQKGASQLSK